MRHGDNRGTTFISAFAVAALLTCLLCPLLPAQCRCYREQPLDVVLILDSSDSMKDVTWAVKSSAHQTIAALREHVTSLRIGLITYGHEDPELTPLTGNVGRIKRAIDRMRNFGNYEPIDQALEMALRRMKWRADARKVIILVGDEPPEDERRENGIHLSYAHATECGRRGIPIHTVSATRGERPVPEFEVIARRSSGEHHTLEGAAVLPAMLINLSLGYSKALPAPDPDRPIDYGFGPLLVAKLSLGKGWGMDRGDVAALLAEAKGTLKEDYSWCLVGSKVSSDELSKARILYLSAHGHFDFGDALRDRIREFVAAGGFILADDCCQNKEFDESFREEMKKLFPEKPLDVLSDRHMVYNQPRRIADAVPRELRGIAVGCRTAVIYSPIDLSCRWVHGPELNKLIADKDAFDIGVNVLHRILFYNASVRKAATLRQKADRPQHVIGHIRFDGFWNPPTHVLDIVFPRVFGEDDTAVCRPIELTDPDLYDYPILYLTGHGAIDLPPEAVKRLKAYLDRGGFLLAEACCGDPAFDRSFRQFVEGMYPGGLQALPVTHPVFSMAEEITEVQYEPSGRKGPPSLEAVHVDKLAAIVYSRYDLSAALLDHPGFVYHSVAKEDAGKLLTNILLYALSH